MNIENIVITSHSKRIRQFINNYFDNFNINKRFMNCGILLMNANINNHKEINIKLVYRGESDINEKREPSLYYDIDEFNNLNLKSTKLIIPVGLNIYFIRHAQGFHNLNNTIIKKLDSIKKKYILKDPQLTLIGNEQAKRTGQFLLNNIPNITIKTLYMCSILLRTRETISNILSELNIFNQDIYVLPCSHEISNFKLPENFIINSGKCINKVSNRFVYKCDVITSKNGVHRFIWDYFSKIKKDNDNKCSQTNMVYEAYLLYALIINKDDEFVNLLRDKLRQII